MQKRTCLIIMVALFTCLSLNQIFGFCCISSDDEKQYISAEQIIVAEEGLYVLTSEGVVPVSMISQDGNGIYYVGWRSWKCPCGHENPWYRVKCEKCHR